MLFQGNQSKKFLQKVDLLERELNKESTEVMMKGLEYVQAFRAFDKVVSSCFGVSLKEGFKEDILEFKRVYTSLGISVTPKVNNLEKRLGSYCFPTYFGVSGPC